MKKIIYYVSTSIDSFISNPSSGTCGFAAESKCVQKYLNDLKEFKTVIMGRKTYEFGYQFGLKPGDAAYPHMEHFIFSDSLSFDTKQKNVHVRKIDMEEIEEIREQSPTDIYLCGGVEFAGWLLDNDQIDILKLKLNPSIFGRGIKLFGTSKLEASLEHVTTEIFDKSLQIITYEIKK